MKRVEERSLKVSLGRDGASCKPMLIVGITKIAVGLR